MGESLSSLLCRILFQDKMILENNLQKILQSNKCDYCGQLELKSHNSLFPSTPAVGFLPGFFLYYILDRGNARPYAL